MTILFWPTAFGDLPITLVWGDVRLPEHLLTEAEVGQAPLLTLTLALALAYASLAQASRKPAMVCGMCTMKSGAIASC